MEGYEVDIYIPELKIGIEYDGVYWHQDKLEKDKEKNAGLSPSVLLIRIREEVASPSAPYADTTTRLQADTIMRARPTGAAGTMLAATRFA